jgi:hypothetical protein
MNKVKKKLTQEAQKMGFAWKIYRAFMASSE